MAAEIKDELEIRAEMIEGANGIFEVKADGQLIYSKARSGRFPEPGEVTKLLKNDGL